MATPNPILKKAEEAKPPEDTSSQVAAIEEALAKSSVRIAESTAVLEEGVAKTSEATEVISSALSDISSSEQIVARTKLNAELQAQNANINILQAAGGHEAQVSLMETLTEEGARVAGLLDEKSDIVDDEFTGVQIIDGIINSFRSFQTDMEIGAARAEQAQTATQISNITAGQESFARVNALTKKTINEGVIEANLKGIAAESRIKGSEAEIKNIHSNAIALNNLMTADNRSVENLLSVFRLKASEEQREIERIKFQFAKDQAKAAAEALPKKQELLDIQLEQGRLALARAKDPIAIAAAEARNQKVVDDIANLKETENQIVSNIQAGQSAAGTAIESREIILFNMRQTGAVGAKYDKFLEIGSSPNQRLGDNAFDAIVSLGTVDASGNAAPTKGTALLDHIARKQAEKYRQPGSGGAPRDEPTLKADFNATATEEMDKFADNVVAGDRSNPYQAPPMLVLESIAAVKQSALYQKVLKPMEMNEVEPQRVVDAALTGVLSKSISPEEAAEGIEILFDSAALYNNTLNAGFDRVGLPSQTSYNTQLANPFTNFDRLKSLIPTTLGEIADIPSAALRFVPTLDQPDAPIQRIFEAKEEFTGIFEPSTLSVDLMDGTRVQEYIVKLLSSAPPIPPTEEKEAPPAEEN